MKKTRNKKSYLPHVIKANIDNETMYKLIDYSDKRKLKHSAVIRQALKIYLKACNDNERNC